MKTKKSVCLLCKDTGVVIVASEYPNLSDSRCCPQCEAGWKLARLIDRSVTRMLSKGRAA